MLARAEAGSMRCYLLFADGAPIAYLTLPVDGDTLVYAFLGFDPDWARLSPGTVLQMEALERLFAEDRYRYFDFTEGHGAHKAMFGTDRVQCASFYLLKPTLTNRAILASLATFDRTVAATRNLATRAGVAAAARRVLRT